MVPGARTSCPGHERPGRLIAADVPVATLLRSGSPSFVSLLLGKVPIMDRARLLAEIFDATSPNDTSTAIFDAREWLADHPDDQKVWSAMADLIEVERQSVSHA